MQTKLFSELDREEAAALDAIAALKRIPKGAVLFLEGDAAVGFYVLLSGSVRIYKSTPDGKEYTMHRIRPGHMFAEAAIFRGSGYPASCMALEDSEAAFMPKNEFLALLRKYPQIALKMIGGLATWLREFTVKVEELSLKEVPARLAGYLLGRLEESGANSFVLDSSKTELASRLGTVLETLSRSLGKLKSAGIIEVEGRRVKVLDTNRLKALSKGKKI
ncbi:MAG: Crp/Fnr family transcriptional regulator [candidate division Zixibacteria bacterium]|nr:Crp/Fnr family transcriptional regulator [candidate division Zixibacteria bacterium]